MQTLQLQKYYLAANQRTMPKLPVLLLPNGKHSASGVFWQQRKGIDLARFNKIREERRREEKRREERRKDVVQYWFHNTKIQFAIQKDGS